MTTYLQTNGSSDYIETPSLTFNKVVIDFDPAFRTSGAWNSVISNTSNSYFEVNTGMGYSKTSDWNLPTNSSGTTISSFGSYNNVRNTLTWTTTSVETFQLIFASCYGTKDFLSAQIYDIKVYNGANLIAHYDMTTGTVNDQSGNGNNATLVGGTWVGGSTTYIGSGTSQGTSSLTSNETLILTYSGSGQSNGQSTLTDTNKTTLSASGTSNGTTNLITSESYVYSANGSSNGTSNVSSNESIINKANGTTQGSSSLSTSEQLVTPTGTTYSASGQSNGMTDISVHETYIGKVSGEVQSSSSLTSNVSQISEVVSQINGSSSLTTTEQFVGHATTTYSASGNTNASSSLSTNETKTYASKGASDGTTNSSTKDNIVYFPTGSTNGYVNINTTERYVSVFEVIGVIEMNGEIQIILQFVGIYDININLKGVV